MNLPVKRFKFIMTIVGEYEANVEDYVENGQPLPTVEEMIALDIRDFKDDPFMALNDYGSVEVKIEVVE